MPDFTEFLGSDRISAIAFGGADAPRISLAAARNAATPHLLFILDSVPFEFVREAWNAGRFRYFHPPSRIVSVFPAMTDPAIAEFFHVSPCAGVESVHYDGRRLVSGYGSYLAESNAPWFKCVDYSLAPSEHAFAYLFPGSAFRRELADAQSRFAAFARKDEAERQFNPKSKIQNPESAPGATSAALPEFIAYSVATSALGSADGRAGPEYALELLDRYCRQLMFDRRGDVHITLMSDHGHDFTPHHRVDIAAELSRRGFRVRDRIESDRDVVVPAFGLVSCVALHTQTPERVARECLSIPGVEIAVLQGGRDEEPERRRDGVRTIHVLARDASARITRNGDRYRYEALTGDPLELLPILAGLPADSGGLIDDAALFQATIDHEFPDPLDRIWRAFNGLFSNTPDVLLSLDNNTYAGSPDLAVWLEMRGVHGNLHRDSTCAFLMTTLHELPPVLRMRNARDALHTGMQQQRAAQSR